MQAYLCTVCGYLYEEESADRDVEGNLINFENLDYDWTCPICSVRRDLFKPVETEHIPDIPVNKK